MHEITGIHHVTALAGDAQENLDFYQGILGMRLVKTSVNQDAPHIYHLFYADAEGHPGTDLTFFPNLSNVPGRAGIGMSTEVALAIPLGALEYWSERLAQHNISTGTPEIRHGERVLPLHDPHGLAIALVETADAREFTPWLQSPVPVDRQILGLHAVRLWERDLALTTSFLTDTLGFAALGEENGWHRFGIAGGGSGKFLEIQELPDTPRGAWGIGSVHHVAWRVQDEAAELAVRERIAIAKRRPTAVIDRFWFKSVYFLEPGGVLFELATEGPGFTIDEDIATLGEHLVLPPWLESQRSEIQAALPPLRRTAGA